MMWKIGYLVYLTSKLRIFETTNTTRHVPKSISSMEWIESTLKRQITGNKQIKYQINPHSWLSSDHTVHRRYIVIVEKQSLLLEYLIILYYVPSKIPYPYQNNFSIPIMFYYVQIMIFVIYFKMYFHEDFYFGDYITKYLVINYGFHFQPIKSITTLLLFFCVFSILFAFCSLRFLFYLTCQSLKHTSFELSC